MPGLLRLILRLGHAALWPTRVHPAHLLPVVLHDLQLAGIAAAALIGLAGVVLAVRRITGAMSFDSGPSDGAKGKRRFRLSLPEAFERTGLEGFFPSMSQLLRPVLLASQQSVTFTFLCVGERLEIELSCSAEIAGPVVAALEAAIDGIGTDELPDNHPSLQRWRWARCTLRPSGSRWLPLQPKQKVDPARFVLAQLRGESEQERACVQAVFSPLSGRMRRRGRLEPRRLRSGRRGGLVAGAGLFGLEVVRDGVEIFLPGTSRPTKTPPTYKPDAWTLKQAGAIEEKTAEPLIAATVRLAVSGSTHWSRRSRLRALASSFAQFHALGGLRPGRELLGRRRFERGLPGLRPPLALTAAEAAALLPLPTNLAETRLVIEEAPARRLRPAADAPHSGIRLGRAER